MEVILRITYVHKIMLHLWMFLLIWKQNRYYNKMIQVLLHFQFIKRLNFCWNFFHNYLNFKIIFISMFDYSNYTKNDL